MPEGKQTAGAFVANAVSVLMHPSRLDSPQDIFISMEEKTLNQGHFSSVTRSSIEFGVKCTYARLKSADSI